MLKVGFDGRAMEQLLQQAGLPLWPSERPTTTVLLFAPSVAGGARAVTAAERPPERLEIERAAQVRGVPLTWPAETVDAAHGANAGWPAQAARRPCCSAAAGAGRLRLDLRSCRARPHAARAVPRQGSGSRPIRWQRVTRRRSTRGVSTVAVRIGGLDGVRAYAALTTYLDGLSLVRRVSLRELSGGTVLLDLGVRGDLELLRRIFALDGRLAPAPRTEAATTQEAPDFVWQP